jgi:hypothetical protein
VPAQTLNPIKVGGESGFVDLEMPFIRTASIQGEGDVLGIAVEFGGLFNGKTAKYVVLVPRDWDDAPLAGIRINPMPKSSDLGFRAADDGSAGFLEMISSVYRLPPKSRKPKEFVGVQALALGGVPEPLESGSLETKVFFRGSSLDEYAELFVHVDFPRRVVRFNEKDPEYCSAILDGLSE